MFDFYGMQFVFAYVRTSSEVLEKWMEKGSKIRSALHQFSFGMGVIVCVCVCSGQNDFTTATPL